MSPEMLQAIAAIIAASALPIQAYASVIKAKKQKPTKRKK